MIILLNPARCRVVDTSNPAEPAQNLAMRPQELCLYSALITCTVLKFLMTTLT